MQNFSIKVLNFFSNPFIGLGEGATLDNAQAVIVYSCVRKRAEAGVEISDKDFEECAADLLQPLDDKFSDKGDTNGMPLNATKLWEV